MKPPPSLQAYRDASKALQADDGALVKYRGLRALLARLLFFIPIHGTGITPRMTQDGPVWDVSADSLAAQAPLFVRDNGTIVPGTIGGESPVIGTTSLFDLPAPALSLSGTGTEHVVVEVSATLDVEGGVYVAGYTAITDVEITVDSVAPTSADLKSASGSFKFALATFVDGVKTAQNFSGSLNLSVCDDGTASGTGQLYIESAA